MKNSIFKFYFPENILRGDLQLVITPGRNQGKKFHYNWRRCLQNFITENSGILARYHRNGFPDPRTRYLIYPFREQFFTERIQILKPFWINTVTIVIHSKFVSISI